MAAPDLEERYLKAGHEFADALKKLGLDPLALLWIYDFDIRRHVLVLVTDFFDLKGPLEISRYLFRAYNASATPKEIDPFLVRLHSPDQAVSKTLLGIAMENADLYAEFGVVGQSKDLIAKIDGFSAEGAAMKQSWVVKPYKHRKRNSVELGRHWARFTQNVDKLAA